MGAGKSTQTTKNNFQYMEPPKNQYFDKAANLYENIDLTTPIISGYGQQDNAIRESGNETFGANTSPEMAQKVRESRLFRSMTDKGRDLSNAVQQENNLKTSGFMSLGDATKPQLINSGGTTTTSTPFNWGSLLSSGIAGGAQLGAAAMTGGASAAAPGGAKAVAS